MYTVVTPPLYIYIYMGYEHCFLHNYTPMLDILLVQICGWDKAMQSHPDHLDCHS